MIHKNHIKIKLMYDRMCEVSTCITAHVYYKAGTLVLSMSRTDKTGISDHSMLSVGDESSMNSVVCYDTN